MLKNSRDNIISGTQIDCSKLGQPAEVSSKIFNSISSIGFNDFVLEYLCIEHQTNDDTARGSKDEDEDEDSKSLGPGNQPSESANTSSLYDDRQHEELIHDISIQIPLSPDVQPLQNRLFFQQKRATHITTSSIQNPTINPFNSSRNRREKDDDDPNSRQRQSLISQDLKLPPEDDSEDRQYSYRRTTAV